MLNRTKLVLPFDTKSYMQIRFSNPIQNPGVEQEQYEETFYHPPLFVKNMYVFTSTKTNQSSRTMNVVNGSQFAGYWEVRSEVNLFLQYGNLFRDCDALEATVRERLGFDGKRNSKCVYFDSSREKSTVYSYAPELPHLESGAFACALLCMVTIAAGSFSGAYALLSNLTCLTAFRFASCFSLSAGFFLTIGIALFHGKCHVLRKMELLPGHDLPFKKMLDESRTYAYGWSFALAWLCVFFCYTSSYVWLSKAQGPSSRKRKPEVLRTRSRRKRLRERLNYKYDRHAIATL